MFPVQLTFAPELAWMLAAEFRGSGMIPRMLRGKTAVKDAIEACGVPHPEVDLIVATPTDGSAPPAGVGFEWCIQSPTRLEIYGVPAAAGILPQAPRLQSRRRHRFVADGHLGTLARNLRLLGLDTAYENNPADRNLLEIMEAEDRALLTRDRRLLMHSVVRHGYCPRSMDPTEQTQEILRRFALDETLHGLAPFTRCLHCNGLLETVSKEAVRGSLEDEPLTVRYYHDFRRCTSCGRIYWPGTHFTKLQARVAEFLKQRT